MMINRIYPAAQAARPADSVVANSGEHSRNVWERVKAVPSKFPAASIAAGLAMGLAIGCLMKRR